MLPTVHGFDHGAADSPSPNMWEGWGGGSERRFAPTGARLPLPTLPRFEEGKNLKSDQKNPLHKMFFSRASRSSCSRNIGWAMEMSALARSATDLPLRFTMPYSVATYMVSTRGVVTMLPGVRPETTRLCGSPFLS